MAKRKKTGLVTPRMNRALRRAFDEAQGRNTRPLPGGEARSKIESPFWEVCRDNHEGRLRRALDDAWAAAEGRAFIWAQEFDPKQERKEERAGKTEPLSETKALNLVLASAHPEMRAKLETLMMTGLWGRSPSETLVLLAAAKMQGLVAEEREASPLRVVDDRPVCGWAVVDAMGVPLREAVYADRRNAERVAADFNKNPGSYGNLCSGRTGPFGVASLVVGRSS